MVSRWAGKDIRMLSVQASGLKFYYFLRPRPKVTALHILPVLRLNNFCDQRLLNLERLPSVLLAQSSTSQLPRSPSYSDKFPMLESLKPYKKHVMRWPFSNRRYKGPERAACAVFPNRISLRSSRDFLAGFEYCDHDPGPVSAASVKAIRRMRYLQSRFSRLDWPGDNDRAGRAAIAQRVGTNWATGRDVRGIRNDHSYLHEVV